MSNKPVELPIDIWIGWDLVLNKHVFIHTGQPYDHIRYDLLYTITADQVSKLLIDSSRAPVIPGEACYPLPEYGELLTRQEYEEYNWIYDTCYASDGKVYWGQDPQYTACSHVLCLSK